MKKIFITLLLAAGIYTATFAQTNNQVEFGANIGYNVANVQSGNISNNDYRSGFNLGVSGDYFFSDRWSIKAKLIYDQKGWANGFISADGSGDVATDYKLNYLTIPVMANWHFGRTRNWYLNFGPYVGILLSGKETSLGTDLKPYLNSTDFGLAAGIGVKFPVTDNAKLFIEADGQSGVTDIFKANSGSSVQTERSSINFGVTFSIN